MFSTEVLQTALVALKRIQEGSYDKVCGICYNLNGNADWEPGTDSTGNQLVAHYAKSWQHYTGEKEYPVPHPELPAWLAYTVANLYLWDKSHPYGSLRWDLLNHIIECIEEELQSV